MNRSSAFITKASIQAAFIAIASRIVGSTFRFLETLNPVFQQAQVIADPPTVLMREVVTISMAWILSLGTHMLIQRLVRKYPFWGQFVTTIIGTAAANPSDAWLRTAKP